MKTDRGDFNFRVIFKFHDVVRVTSQVANLENHDLTPFNAICGKRVNKLFSTVTSERIVELTKMAITLDRGYHPPNFLNYYSVECETEIEAKEIMGKLRKQAAIDQIYVETYSSRPPSVNKSSNPLSSHQEYLNPAPLGIDAFYAWQFPGGNGRGTVRFVDIEQGWIFNHEDIKVNVLPCTGLSHYQYADHGAGVLGIIMMQDNAVGGIGITPEVSGFVISQWRPDGSFNTADSIMAAVDHLSFGDVMLLEAQTFGSLDTKKIVPIEILDANFEAIRLATALGIVVVEAAGNGMNSKGSDLDNFIDGNNHTIFNRQSICFKDSGAMVVAGSSADSGHTRINYSNYGSRIDCFAWGEKVVTTGLFPRSFGSCNNGYTKKFCGTSSASAIIAGVSIAVQSISEANYGVRLSPKEMREILGSELYGTSSLHGRAVDKIGVMPDLKKVIDKGLNFHSFASQNNARFYQKVLL